MEKPTRPHAFPRDSKWDTSGSGIIKSNGTKAWTKGIRPQDTLTREERILKAGLFGFIAGDGNIQQGKFSSGCLRLCTGDDKEVAEKLKDILDLIYGPGEEVSYIRSQWSSKNGEQWIVICSRKEVIADIKNLCPNWDWSVGKGIRKTWDIPAWILSDREYKRAFVAWYCEADGGVVEGKKTPCRRIDFTSINGNGIRQVQTVLEEFGVVSKLYTYPGRLFRNDKAKVRQTRNNLTIFRKEAIRKYAEEFGFMSKKKQEKLKRVLSVCEPSVYDKWYTEVKQWANEGLSAQQVVVKLKENGVVVSVEGVKNSFGTARGIKFKGKLSKKQAFTFWAVQGEGIEFAD